MAEADLAQGDGWGSLLRRPSHWFLLPGPPPSPHLHPQAALTCLESNPALSTLRPSWACLSQHNLARPVSVACTPQTLADTEVALQGQAAKKWQSQDKGP